jgi:hypothetical protein
MRDHKFCVLILALLATLLLATAAPAYGYVGPGPGLEMLPFFYSLLAWLGMAVSAMLAWPIAALLRRLWPRTVKEAVAAGNSEQGEDAVGR